jgi:hypothetical protein
MDTMKVKALIARLSELDPEDDIFFMDGEYGVTEITDIRQEHHHITSAGGRQLPKMVWAIQ